MERVVVVVVVVVVIESFHTALLDRAGTKAIVLLADTKMVEHTIVSSKERRTMTIESNKVGLEEELCTVLG